MENRTKSENLSVGCMSERCVGEQSNKRNLRKAKHPNEKRLAFINGFLLCMPLPDIDQEFIYACNASKFPVSFQTADKLKASILEHYRSAEESSNMRSLLICQKGNPISMVNILDCEKTPIALTYYALPGDYFVEPLFPGDAPNAHKVKSIFQACITYLLEKHPEMKRIIIQSSLLKMLGEKAGNMGFKRENPYSPDHKQEGVFSCNKSELASFIRVHQKIQPNAM